MTDWLPVFRESQRLLALYMCGEGFTNVLRYNGVVWYCTCRLSLETAAIYTRRFWQPSALTASQVHTSWKRRMTDWLPVIRESQ